MHADTLKSPQAFGNTQNKFGELNKLKDISPANSYQIGQLSDLNHTLQTTQALTSPGNAIQDPHLQNLLKKNQSLFDEHKYIRNRNETNKYQGVTNQM